MERDDFRIGEATGARALTVYGVSPYFFPQRKLRNWKYLPLHRDLPSGLQFTALVFSWGFTPDTPGLAALETQNKIIQIKKPTWIWAINSADNDATGSGGSDSGFQCQIYHTHNGVQSRFFNRPLRSRQEVFGNGQLPFTLTQPHLFLPNDSVEVEVKNLGNPVAPAVTSISVAMFGGEYEGTV